MRKQLATIIVSPGMVSLDCTKGTTQLPVPIDPDSVLGAWESIDLAIEDLVVLAKPQKCRLLLIIDNGDPAPIEALLANEYRLRSTVADVYWATGRHEPATLLKPPETTSKLESAGWSYKCARWDTPAAQLFIVPGTLKLKWQGMSTEEPIERHSRLLVPDFPNFANALIKARKALGLLKNTVVEIQPPSDRIQLCSLDHQVIKNAIIEAKMTAIASGEKVVNGTANVSPRNLNTVVLCMLALAPLLVGPLLSRFFDLLEFDLNRGQLATLLLLSTFIATIFVWRERHQRQRSLGHLLHPKPNT